LPPHHRIAPRFDNVSESGLYARLNAAFFNKIRQIRTFAVLNADRLEVARTNQCSSSSHT
ncbi:hypothetical protein, partial [Rhizomicrobium electricum]